MGMPLECFWYDDSDMVDVYVRKHELEREMNNHKAWLNGLYHHQATSVVMHNAFKKKNDLERHYPQKPLEIYPKSEEEVKAKESKRLYNQMKAVMQHVNNSRKKVDTDNLLKQMDTIVSPEGKRSKLRK